MRLSEYQKAAWKTAIYPKKGKNPIYPILGFCGEAGELLEKIEQFENPSEKSSNKDAGPIIKELGDVCWYIMAIASEFGVKVTSYTSRGNDEGKIINAIRIVQGACWMAEKAKKLMRDKQYIPPIIVQVSISVGFEKASQIAKNYGTTLGRVLGMNIRKLKSRQKRGKLRGSGDNR